MTADDIFVRVLGDHGPFPTMGKSIGYQVTIHTSERVSNDIGGCCFPRLTDDGSRYVERPDGQVELVTFTPEGSRGTVVADQRGRLSCPR